MKKNRNPDVCYWCFNYDKEPVWEEMCDGCREGTLESLEAMDRQNKKYRGIV